MMRCQLCMLNCLLYVTAASAQLCTGTVLRKMFVPQTLYEAPSISVSNNQDEHSALGRVAVEAVLRGWSGM